MIIGSIYCRRGDEHLAVMAIKPIESVRYSVFSGVIRLECTYTPEKYSEINSKLKNSFYPFDLERR